MEQVNRKNREPYWKDKVNEFNRSGMTQKEFCLKHELSYWSFNSWKRRIESSSEENSLVEIIPKTISCLSAPEESFEIILSDKIRIKIPDNFSEENLSRIIKVLETVK